MGQQLTCGAICEGLGTHPREHLVGSAQLLAGIEPPAFAAQPFATEEMGASELHADAGAAETIDRLEIEALGGIAVAQERPRARLDPQRPVGAAGPGSLRQTPQRVGRTFGLAAANRGHELRFDRDWVWIEHRGAQLARYPRSYVAGAWQPAPRLRAEPPAAAPIIPIAVPQIVPPALADYAELCA